MPDRVFAFDPIHLAASAFEEACDTYRKQMYESHDEFIWVVLCCFIQCFMLDHS